MHRPTFDRTSSITDLLPNKSNKKITKRGLLKSKKMIGKTRDPREMMTMTTIEAEASFSPSLKICKDLSKEEEVQSSIYDLIS